MNVSKGLRKKKKKTESRFWKHKRIEELEATYAIIKMARGFLFAKADDQPVSHGLPKLDLDYSLMRASENINARK